MNSIQESVRAGPFVPTIREKQESFCFSSIGNVALIFWNRPPDLAAFNKVETHMLALFREYPKGVGSLVLSRAATPPGGEIAKEGAEQLVRWGQSLAALGAVQESTGVLSALVRVTMQTIIALSSNKGATKPKLFGNLDEAARWLAGTLHAAGNLEVPSEAIPEAVSWLAREYPPPAN